MFVCGFVKGFVCAVLVLSNVVRFVLHFLWYAIYNQSHNKNKIIAIKKWFYLTKEYYIKQAKKKYIKHVENKIPNKIQHKKKANQHVIFIHKFISSSCSWVTEIVKNWIQQYDLVKMKRKTTATKNQKTNLNKCSVFSLESKQMVYIFIILLVDAHSFLQIIHYFLASIIQKTMPFRAFIE